MSRLIIYSMKMQMPKYLSIPAYLTEGAGCQIFARVLLGFVCGSGLLQKRLIYQYRWAGSYRNLWA